MPNTYTQIYIHIVFAVENRVSLIRRNWKEQLHKYITSIVQNNGHKLISINSIPDHIHIFIGMKPKQSLSTLIQEIKSHSSKWINNNKFALGKFQWQMVMQTDAPKKCSGKLTFRKIISKLIQNQFLAEAAREMLNLISINMFL